MYRISLTDTKERKLVAYLRVSTDKQGIRGLGIEAQRRAVHDYASRQGGTTMLLAEYMEVESGRKADRPELWKAIDHARNSGALLVIAKLDRLSRDVHFLTGLDKAGVEFVACDMPNANRLTITILAAVAEHEREMISQRTKAALAVARIRIGSTGQRPHPHVKRLGNPNGARALAGSSNSNAIAKIKQKADEAALRIKRVIDDVRCDSELSTEGIARELNQRGVLSPRGHRWHRTTVIRLLKRLEPDLTESLK
ncbi:MAG TPA: recombinase family protein [Xanthobacteraceae bacterium]|nr:recombinase family protein [Xanthobacteraceae bacterium]